MCYNSSLKFKKKKSLILFTVNPETENVSLNMYVTFNLLNQNIQKVGVWVTVFLTVHQAVITDWGFKWTHSLNWVRNPAETLHAAFCIYQNILQ